MGGEMSKMVDGDAMIKVEEFNHRNHIEYGLGA